MKEECTHLVRWCKFLSDVRRCYNTRMSVVWIRNTVATELIRRKQMALWCLSNHHAFPLIVRHSSQLYGSTTVVMAIYGLHRKWWSLTPCQRYLCEPIGKIFGTIDYVINLSNLAKFGFGKISRDWGTYTQHIRFCAFFSTFYALWHGYSLNGWTDFNAQYLKRRRLVRGGAFSMTEKNRNLTLTFKRSKSAILFGLQNFDLHYLENGTR